MANAKVLTLVRVTLDGREMIVTNVLLYQDVFMEVAMALHWPVHVIILLSGLEDFVISLYVTIVSMGNVFHLVHANVTLVGLARTALIVNH